jgi:hypothetical protein
VVPQFGQCAALAGSDNNPEFSRGFCHVMSSDDVLAMSDAVNDDLIEMEKLRTRAGSSTFAILVNIE